MVSLYDDSLEKIGYITSPSTTTDIKVDILGTAHKRSLVGELVTFEFIQNNQKHYVIGQITQIENKNVMLESQLIKNIIKEKGRLESVSEKRDVLLGEIKIGAIFSIDEEGLKEASMNTIPPTGTPVYIANDNFLGKLFENVNNLFYLGYAYGSRVKLPLWFKHFGEGGAKEAYHIGILGKTGCGKSTLAKMILCAYAQYPEMTAIIFDVQGEFARDFGNSGNDFRDIIQNKKEIEITKLSKIGLDRWHVFIQLLSNSEFMSEKLKITVSGGYTETGARLIAKKLIDEKIQLGDIAKREVFEKYVHRYLNNLVIEVYKTEDSRNRVIQRLRTLSIDELYKSWLQVAVLFAASNEKKTINALIEETLTAKKILIIDLSNESSNASYSEADNIKSTIINEFVKALSEKANSAYQEGRLLNTLVVFDEAHRFVPQNKIEDNEIREQIRIELIDAVRTTRKYGLGWMFITQSTNSISKDIINQLRILFVGYGLTLGSELSFLKELVFGDSEYVKLYQSFKDPQSFIDEKNKTYSFMTVGPVSPLSANGSPLFFNAFTDIDTFREVNKI